MKVSLNILTVFIVLCNQSVHGQWQQVFNPVDSSIATAEAIIDIEFNGDSSGIAIGDYFICLGTHDFGNTWQLRQDFTDTANGYFTGLYHIDSSQYIITGLQAVYRSFDDFGSFQVIHYNYPFIGFIGGLSTRVPNEFHFLSIDRNVYIESSNLITDYFYDISTLDTANPAGIKSSLEVFFASDSVGYILSSTNEMRLFDNVIHRTRDGGQTWKNISHNSAIIDMHFFTNSYGIGYDGLHLYFIEDYGNTWRWIDPPISGWPPNRASLYHPLEIVSDSIWYIYSDSKIIRTSNAGLSWQAINTPNCGGCVITELACPNDTTCYLGTAPPAIYKVDNIKQLITSIDPAQIISADDQITFFPIPAGDDLNISVKDVAKNSTIEIINTIGNTVFQQKLTKSESRISIKNWPSGVYVVIIKVEERPTVVKKFNKH